MILKYFLEEVFIESWIYFYNIDSLRYNCWFLVKNENRIDVFGVMKIIGWSFNFIKWEEFFVYFYIILVLYKD